MKDNHEITRRDNNNRLIDQIKLSRLIFVILFLTKLITSHESAYCAILVDDPSEEIKALVLLNAKNEDEMQAILNAIETLDAHVLASFPNQGAFVSLPPDQVSSLRQMSGVRKVILSSANTSLAGNDKGAYYAIVAWNAHLSPTLPNSSASVPALPDNDLVIDDIYLQRQVREIDSGRPTSYQTSLYMHGSVQVDIFLVESNGNIDSNYETWSTHLRDQVVAEITTGNVQGREALPKTISGSASVS